MIWEELKHPDNKEEKHKEASFNDIFPLHLNFLGHSEALPQIRVSVQTISQDSGAPLLVLVGSKQKMQPKIKQRSKGKLDIKG